MRPIIQARNLSKQYKIAARKVAYNTLRDSIAANFRNLFKRDDDRTGNNKIWALKEVSFDIMSGDVVGIIGRNGAGKSTLLKILSRITEPTAGEVDIYGRVGSLLEVGTGFHLELSGRENVYLNGAVLGMHRHEIDRKFDEIVAFAEVERFIDTPVKHYSSGMYMRLAFSVAAHLEPEIMIVDEVLAVGDAAFQKRCLGKMGDIAKEGKTVIFVSHNIPAIRSLCSKGIYLDKGELVAEGHISDCIHNYLHSNIDRLTDVNTEHVQRPLIGIDESRSLRITRVSMADNMETGVFATGETILLTISFKTICKLENVVFGFTVHSIDGILLFECRSTGSEKNNSYLPIGEYTIQAKMNFNPLMSGYYVLSVGARCENKPLDWLPNLITFQVQNHESYGSIWLEAPSGMLRVNSDWSDIEG